MKPRDLVRTLVSCAALVGVLACRDNGPDIAPATITVAPVQGGALTVMSGASMTLFATVKSSAGTQLFVHAVSWISTDPSIVAISSAGVVTGARAGEADIIATAGGMNSPSAHVTVIPGVAARLAVRLQPAGAVSGGVLATQPVIELRDAAGNLASGSVATVTATIATGGGTITGSAATAANGVATFTALALSGTIGDRTLLFSAPGVASISSIGVAVTHGVPARLVIRTQPTGASSDAPLLTQPVLELRDAAGNLATATSASVTAGLGNGTGNLTNATATASNGVVAFTGLTISGAPGDRTLTFSATGVPTISSTTFALSPSR